MMVLLSAHRFAGTNNSVDIKNSVISINKAELRFDTFFAVRIISGGYPPKTMVKDTIVLVMHNMPKEPPAKKAVTRYNFEMLPYNPFDSGAPSKSAVRDTLVWTTRPYRP